MSQIFKRSAPVRLTNNTSDDLLNLFNASPAPSGVRVNHNSILSIPHFFNAVRIIANSLARTDVASYKILEDGGREIDDNINAHWLLNWKFNDFQNAFIGKQCMISNMLWSGHSYTYIERNNYGEPTALYNLDPQSVYEITQYDQNGIIQDAYFGYSHNNKSMTFDYNDVIHLQNLSSLTGTCGLGIPQILRTCLGKAIGVMDYQSYYLENGTSCNRVIKIPGWLDDVQREEIVKQAKAYSGIKNSGKMMILQGGSELAGVPLNNQDFQLIEQAQLSIAEIANIVGIPGSLIGQPGAVSYNSAQMDMDNFLNLTMDSIFSQVENELTLKLLKPRQQYVSHFIEFDRSSLFASDPSYDARIINKYNNNMITFQEARQAFKLSANPTGDLKTPIGKDAVVQAQAAPGQPPAEAPAAPGQDKGLSLVRATVNRLFKRLEKSIATDPNLDKHFEIIKENLPINSEVFIRSLEGIQEEINHVLPEQRVNILDRINKEDLCNQIWN